ncbi:MAG: glycosyltransferase family 2 protein [Flavobacteriales bacterium]|nr:glycosyltransferase family 2 protein [Flavobacteriales bacterium]
MSENITVDISIVIPLYNEEESLLELISWIDRVCTSASFSYEALLIDDGSKDKSWQIVEELKLKFPSVRGIKFRRNYGKSAALNTGFAVTKGNVVITMDADLQDSPDEIPELYRMITEEDYDIVSGWKKERHDPLSKTIPTKLYNGVTRIFSGIKLHDMNCGLKAYKGDVVRSIEIFGEMHRYIPVIAKGAGFDKIGEKVVQHQERKYGVSKFGLNRFVNGFLDLFTITFITRFGKKPMHFFGLIGTLFFILGFGLTFWLGIDKLFINQGATLLADNTWFHIALFAMILGTQLFLAGFIAELIGRNSPIRNNYAIEKEI